VAENMEGGSLSKSEVEDTASGGMTIKGSS
jgi:hypothetical protein